MSDPKDVVRRFFDTLGTGDFDAIGKFFTDESVWQVNDVARGLPAQRGGRGSSTTSSSRSGRVSSSRVTRRSRSAA